MLLDRLRLHDYETSLTLNAKRVKKPWRTRTICAINCAKRRIDWKKPKTTSNDYGILGGQTAASTTAAPLATGVDGIEAVKTAGKAGSSLSG